MGLISRNLTKPRFAKNWEFNPHGINILFGIAILFIIAFVIYTAVQSHSQNIPVIRTNMQQGAH